MVVSDELPKARKRGEKVNFFFENLSLLPETSAPKEHFKLVFGSGNSDLAKIRPLKVGPPAISWKSSLFRNFHRLAVAAPSPKDDGGWRWLVLYERFSQPATEGPSVGTKSLKKRTLPR